MKEASHRRSHVIWFHLHEILRIGSSLETESWSVVSRGWKEQGVAANGYGVSFWDAKRVLGSWHSGMYCWCALYLERTKCHWTVEFKMPNCMLCECYLNFNKSKPGISCTPCLDTEGGGTHSVTWTLTVFSSHWRLHSCALTRKGPEQDLGSRHTRQYCGTTGTGQKGRDFLWVRVPPSTLKKWQQPEEKAGCLKKYRIWYILFKRKIHTHTWKEVFILFQGYSTL